MQGRPTSLAPLMLALGAAALVGQTVLVRELMVSFYGTELALASVLSCWLLFIPLGALAGTGVAARTDRPLRLAYLCLAAMSLGLVAEFFLARSIRPLLGAQTAEFLSLWPMVWGAALAAAPTAFWVGFFFPVAALVEEGRSRTRALGISRIYVAEAIGSALAGALLSFYLLSRLDPAVLVAGAAAILLFCGAWHAAGASRRLLGAGLLVLVLLLCLSAALDGAWPFFVGAPLVGSGFWAIPRFGEKGGYRGPLAAGLLGGGLALSVAYLLAGPQAAETAARARWRTFSRFRRVASLESRYQHLELGEREGTYTLVQDGLRTAQFPDPDARKSAAMLLTQHPAPRDVLLIGGGLGGLCQSLLDSALHRLDYVEPDPRLLSLVYSHLPRELKEPLRDPRFAAWRWDGRNFVHSLLRGPAPPGRRRFLPRGPGGRDRPGGRYDLILLNVGDPVSAADNRLYTVEFYREVAAVLRPGGGAVLFGITGSENYLATGPVLSYAASHYAALRRVFGKVVVSPGDELRFSVGRHATASPEALASRFEQQGLSPAPLKHSLKLEHFPPERVRWATSVLRQNSAAAPVSTDARPVLFTLFLAVQKHYTRGAPAPGEARDVFARLRSARSLWFAAPVLLLPAVVGVFSIFRGRGRSVPVGCGLTVFTTGVFGLSAEMLIVYRYQTSFGFVYRDISIIVGLFMLGLALGGWLMGRKGKGRDRSALLWVEAFQAVYVLTLPLLCGLVSSSSGLFMALSPLAGFLTGAEFPLAARISLEAGGRAESVAGFFDAADHLGALLGGACTGLLLVPAWGVYPTGGLVALLKCAGLVSLLILFLPRRALPSPLRGK